MGKIDYLRLSVTDRCNLNCIYCRPFQNFRALPRNQILTYEQMCSIVKILNELGIKYVRITGGEPLIKKNIEDFITMLRSNCNLDEITITTNGLLLKEKLSALVNAGIDGINISLNTFRPDRYKNITGYDRFQEVSRSINDMLSSKLPLKINVVLMTGINDDEILDFASFTLNKKVGVRFIEYFSTTNFTGNLKYVPNNLVKEKIEKKFGKLQPFKARGHGPSVDYRIKGSEGHMGFISYHTQNYCKNCNRLRLKCDGKLYPCLFSDYHLDLKNMVQENRVQDIEKEVKKIISMKENHLIEKDKNHQFVMSGIGG